MHPKISSLLQAMVSYDRGDARRIHHFIKVHDFAAAIAQSEHLSDEETFIVESAAIVHDIGIHLSEQRYGDTSGEHQQQLGPDEARQLLQQVGGYNERQIERICFLVAHHHTYDNVQGMDWQILLEADFLVNAYEDQMSVDAVKRFAEHIFKTSTGRQLLSDMLAL